MVCFFGAWDPNYPRNRVIRSGLARAGVEVCEARTRDVRAFRRFPALITAFGREGVHADTLLVPEFRHKDVPLARLLAGRRRLIFDPLVSRTDTLVDDWGLHARGSAQARWNAAIDRIALALPDVVLCDTWAHGRLYQSLGVPAAKLRRVLVGAEDAFFAVPARASAEIVRVLYLGGFLPLHGVAHALDAVERLERDGSLPPFRFTFAGRGIEWEEMQRRAAERGLTRVDFPGRIAYDDAPQLIARHDIVLGAFGAGAKAGRVIPHKVYQGLAAGRAVVTGEGEGVREVFEPGRHLETVPRGDGAALAATLASLIGDSARRDRLAREGAARAREIATPERIGADLAAVLAERMR